MRSIVAFLPAGRLAHGRIIFLLLSALALYLTACETSAGSGEDAIVRALERKSGLIAYIGLDGNIHTVNQGGGRQRAVTIDARPQGVDDTGPPLSYLYPTWSRQGRRLAFVQITGPLNAPEVARIMTSETDGSDMTVIFRSESAIPFYLAWEPFGERLAFLSAGHPGGLALQLVEDRVGEKAQVLDIGQSYFWDWSPGGNQFLIHANPASESTRLSILTQMERVVEEVLDTDTAAFQSPTWSPDGERLLVYLSGEENGGQLQITDRWGVEMEVLAESEEPAAAFAWSPDGRKVAFIFGEPLAGQGLLGQLSVIGLDNGEEPILAGEERAMAFSWSPDNKKLAYFVPSVVPASSEGEGGEDILVMALFVMNVSNGETKLLNVFRPTTEFFNILGLFDQYHRSATFWSPDSKNLVVSAVTGENNRGIWVVNASGRIDPRFIAPGVLAFWSWE